jgi:hypothetical protein
MPSGPPSCQLAVSARRTSATGCSSWPTPDASVGQYIRHDLGAAARGSEGQIQQRQRLWADDRPGGQACGVADAENGGRRQPHNRIESGREGSSAQELGELARSDGVECRPRAPDSFWSAADWIFCRDGKWRPTQSIIFTLAHGTSPRLGRMRATEEIDDPDQRSPAAFLRSVREEIGEEAFFERIGGLLSLPRAEILRSGLYGAGNGERGLSEPQSQPVEGGQDGEARMRDVRECGANARSSHGREPKKQRAIELDDVMSFLSSSAASPLVDASAFDLGSGGPCQGMSRAGMLRGYGNAIVLPVATAFVEAAMEALPCT